VPAADRRRLIAAGYALSVWNRSPEKAEPLVEQGASLAATPVDLAESAPIILLCVSDAKAVDAVLFGDRGLASGRFEGRILVDHSSIHPDATRQLAARLEAQSGMRWIDAPVSGGVPGAEAGTLAIMCGGRAEDFAKVQPVLTHLSARATLFGDVGAGQTAKLCNQMIVGCALATIAEALRFASDAGIDAHRLMPALAGGFADSKPFQIFGPRMLDGAAEPIGHIDTVLKDVETALDVGRSQTTSMPMTATAAQLYRLLAAQGLGRREFDALYTLGRPAKV